MKGTAFAVVLAGLTAATSAHACGPEAGKLSFPVFAGIDIPTSGDVHGVATAPVPDLGLRSIRTWPGSRPSCASSRARMTSATSAPTATAWSWVMA